MNFMIEIIYFAIIFIKFKKKKKKKKKKKRQLEVNLINKLKCQKFIFFSCSTPKHIRTEVFGIIDEFEGFFQVKLRNFSNKRSGI